MKKLLLCFIYITAISCNSDSEEFVLTEDNAVVKQILRNGKIDSDFAYDRENRIIRERNFDGANIYYLYDNEDRIVQINEYHNIHSNDVLYNSTEFTYEGDNVTKRIFRNFRPTPEYTFVYYYIYNTDNTITAKLYIGAGGIESYLSETTYRIESGNVVEVIGSGGPLSPPQHFITYDDKHNTHKNVLGYDKLWMAANRNNVIQRAADQPFTYTYNELGFPVSRTHLTSSGTVIHTYIYQ